MMGTTKAGLFAKRRKLLAAGGLGAVMGFMRRPAPVQAAHQVEDIGIGVENPTSGPPPTNVTRLITNSSGGGFSVSQTTGAQGTAISGTCDLVTAGSGGDGLLGIGGSLEGSPAPGRRGGKGLAVFGGAGGDSGAGGAGIESVGGGSETYPADGILSIGGRGEASTVAPGGVGVRGVGGVSADLVSVTGIGVMGQSQTAEGVRGESSTGPGALGVSSSYVGVFAQSSSSWALYANSPSYAGVFQGSVYIAGGLRLLGGFLAAVKHPDGSSRAAHGVTSAEPVIEDFGRARLTNGTARVDFDPTFAALVQAGESDIFLTPYGDCKGLFVAGRTASGFDVRELQGGASTLDFGYRVVARRRDTDRSRLAKIDQLPPLPSAARTEIPGAPHRSGQPVAPGTGHVPGTAPAPRR